MKSSGQAAQNSKSTQSSKFSQLVVKYSSVSVQAWRSRHSRLCCNWSTCGWAHKSSSSSEGLGLFPLTAALPETGNDGNAHEGKNVQLRTLAATCSLSTSPGNLAAEHDMSGATGQGPSLSPMPTTRARCLSCKAVRPSSRSSLLHACHQYWWHACHARCQ